MPTRDFISAVDTEFGLFGWRPAEYADGNALAGFAVAHDTIEHFPDDHGGLIGELEAFGAIWRTRVQAGWFERHRRVPIVEYVADDLRAFFAPALREGYELPEPKAFPTAIPCNADGPFHDIAAEIVRGLPEDIKGVMRAGEFISRATSWLGVGYRRAQHRYRRADPDSCAYCFDLLAKKADEALVALDGVEGLTIRATANPTARTASVWILDPGWH